MSSTPKKPLIMTFAHGYQWADLSVFFQSLRSTTYDGDVVVFASRLSEATMDRMREAGATVIPVWLPLFHLRNVFLIPGWLPWRLLFSMVSSSDIRRSISKRVFNIMCARFAHFQHYLSDNIGRYSHVMVTDIRDVCFQRNPFEHPLPGDIVSFLEIIPLGGGVNRKWLSEAFGNRVDNRLYAKDVSCAGVTLGTSEAMMRYLDLMLGGLQKVERMTPVAGVDQAVHNDILHLDKIPCSVLLGNGNPLCNTMGHGDPLSLDTMGNVLARDGTKIAILHQFDRIPEVAKPKMAAYSSQ